jgi:hypothetical protein
MTRHRKCRQRRVNSPSVQAGDVSSPGSRACSQRDSEALLRTWEPAIPLAAQVGSLMSPPPSRPRNCHSRAQSGYRSVLERQRLASGGRARTGAKTRPECPCCVPRDHELAGLHTRGGRRALRWWRHTPLQGPDAGHALQSCAGWGQDCFREATKGAARGYRCPSTTSTRNAASSARLRVVERRSWGHARAR